MIKIKCIIKIRKYNTEANENMLHMLYLSLFICKYIKKLKNGFIRRKDILEKSFFLFFPKMKSNSSQWSSLIYTILKWPEGKCSGFFFLSRTISKRIKKTGHLTGYPQCTLCKKLE